MNQIDQKIQLLGENITRLQVCKCLIWVGFVMLMGMFCAIHYVWFKMPLTLINIVFYIGVNCCWFVSLFYIYMKITNNLNEILSFLRVNLENVKPK